MAVADDGSFFSRFTVKFVEITAAGIATAVSGYLIAHVGGLLSAAAVAPSVIPATIQAALPAAAQVAPMGNTVTGSLRAQPVAIDAGERRLGNAQVAPSPAALPERPAANATPATPAVPPRKIATIEPSSCRQQGERYRTRYGGGRSQGSRSPCQSRRQPAGAARSADASGRQSD